MLINDIFTTNWHTLTAHQVIWSLWLYKKSLIVVMLNGCF